MKTNVVFALLGATSAIKIQREPLLSAGASPLLVHQTPSYSSYPVDYFVPNFGAAHEVRYTASSIAQAEKAANHTIVADFGWKAKDPIARDYFVPHFGVDEDIQNVQDAIKSEEGIQAHKWEPKQDANGYWNMPAAADNASYGYNSQQYINNSGLVQLDAESDPICASSGCTQFKHPDPPADHPKDYFVPNFGQDRDVKDTLVNERIASKLVGRQWTFPTGDERWKNPAKNVDYNFAPELSQEVRDSINSAKIAETSVGKWDV